MLHEMGHVIGIGSLWTQAPSLLVGSVAGGGTDPYFTGANAIAQFNANGGAGYVGNRVPVANVGGPGTLDSHWRESVMGKELMTPVRESRRQPAQRDHGWFAGGSGVHRELRQRGPVYA